MLELMQDRVKTYTNQSVNFIDTHKRMIEIFLIFLVCALIILDIVWASIGSDTISSEIRKYTLCRSIWIPWVWGIMISHLFFTRKIEVLPIREGLAILLLLFLTIGFGLIGYLSFGFTFDNPWLQITLLMMGVVAGYILWPQRFGRRI